MFEMNRMKKRATVVIVPVVCLATLAALALGLFQETGLPTAEAAPVGAARDLPSTTHVRTYTHYRRYGAALERLVPLEGTEMLTITTSISYGPDGVVRAFESTTSNDDGRVVQRASLSNDKVAIRNLITNDSRLVAWSKEVENASGVRARGEELAKKKSQAISGKQATVLAREAGKLVIRVDAAVPGISSSSGVIPDGAYTIPYVGDLDVSYAYSEVTLDEDTMLTLDMATYAVTNSGTTVLIERRVILADEFVPYYVGGQP